VRPFYLVVSLFVCLLLQATLAPRIAFGEIAPDFVFLVVVVFALYKGAVYGAILGFAVGFLQDLGNPELLGLNALIKTLLGFVIGRVGAKTFPENALFLFGLFATAALGHDIVYLIFFKWPHLGSALLMTFIVALPSALYTAAFGLGMDKLATRFGAKAVAFGKKGQQ
jgi:rod shape-determining protein MreD